MTIAELKEKNITELTKIARSLDLPGASGLRKQDLIFKILQPKAKKKATSLQKECSKSCPMATASCARPTTTICPARTIFMSRHRKIRKFDLKTGDTISGQFARRTRRKIFRIGQD